MYKLPFSFLGIIIIIIITLAIDEMECAKTPPPIPPSLFSTPSRKAIPFEKACANARTKTSSSRLWTCWFNQTGIKILQAPSDVNSLNFSIWGSGTIPEKGCQYKKQEAPDTNHTLINQHLSWPSAGFKTVLAVVLGPEASNPDLCLDANSSKGAAALYMWTSPPDIMDSVWELVFSVCGREIKDEPQQDPCKQYDHQPMINLLFQQAIAFDAVSLEPSRHVSRSDQEKQNDKQPQERKFETKPSSPPFLPHPPLLLEQKPSQEDGRPSSPPLQENLFLKKTILQKEKNANEGQPKERSMFVIPYPRNESALYEPDLLAYDDMDDGMAQRHQSPGTGEWIAIWLPLAFFGSGAVIIVAVFRCR
jgi:hypothetical protein